MDGLLSKEEYKEKRDKIIINMSQNIEENWQFIDGIFRKIKISRKIYERVVWKVWRCLGVCL